MVIQLPTVELQKDFIVTIDRNLGEARFVQRFEDGSGQIIFVPLSKMKEVCELI